ncbi:hypothetical protein L211DRAFT_650596 [Terfezia boudieri ATCC MYA-4762]|uniref:Heterokaryon incompatibility domain-containing protein n=1 Tax=Terfezia boudieri ATCC MYA-4762 TaxID=1051890 RepID=A0A3N4LVC4_9PEZI|nr:hypothetical protein L211DRAFT_650596 [Terfezia boudieri ATCC MYA-4762]
MRYSGNLIIYSLRQVAKPVDLDNRTSAQYGHVYPEVKDLYWQYSGPSLVHKFWLTLSRFLFHTSLKPHQGSMFPLSLPMPSTPKTLIEASIFKYLDLGLSAALITGWFDPHRTPSLLGGMFPVEDLTISNLQRRAEKALGRRARALTRAKTIAHPYNVPPRRLWDLKMNRVIPWYLIDNPDAKAPPPFIAISHSWVNEKDLVFVETPINCYAWPVPLPSGIDLEMIRSEILNAFSGLRYCWLDVLCLRQQSEPYINWMRGTGSIEPSERTVTFSSMPLAQKLLLEALCLRRECSSCDKLRRDEHYIDVPTIGNVYKLAKGVFRYYNGLGRRFSPTGWDNPNHWFNRAWTLQETVLGSVDGGVKDWNGNYLNLEGCMGGHKMKYRDFIMEVEKITGKTASIIGLAQEMGRRYATNDIDKITGLSYLLQMKHLPIYKEDIGVDRAWRRSLWEMPKNFLLELLFTCPVVNTPQWVPSWQDLSNLPPTFVPYPAFQSQPARGGDTRRRFFALCMELGYPKSSLNEMYHTLSTKYSSLKNAPACPGYPFALDEHQYVTDHLDEEGQNIGCLECPIQKRKRELIKDRDIHHLSDSSIGVSGLMESTDGERDHSSGHEDDESYAYVSFVRGVKRPGQQGRHGRDREVGIRGWCLEALSMACTQGNDYCVQVYTPRTNTKTKSLNFFVSHDGLKDSWLCLGEAKPPKSAEDSPKAAFILFTPVLPRLYTHSTHSSTRRPATEYLPARNSKREAYNGCSSWLVLKVDESGESIYRKVGVLRSDETFTLRWMTEGLLRAHLRSGCIFIDTTSTKPETKTEVTTTFEN